MRRDGRVEVRKRLSLIEGREAELLVVVVVVN